MSMEESISLEETNKIRISLGLKPLTDDKAAPADSADALAEKNYAKQRERERKDLESKRIFESIAKVKNRRELNASLKGRTLADLDDAERDVDDARQWIKRSKKQEKVLAKKRQEELESMDKAFQDEYTEKDLTGLKVAHDMDELDEGQERILTLKDSRILDGEEDELMNVEMADHERTKKKQELKIKKPAYTGYDDDEFAEGNVGMKRAVLAKYDEELEGAKETGFRLGAGSMSSRKAPQTKQETAAAVNKSLLSIDYAKNIESSDYVREGDKGFKKPKTKKKRATRVVEADPDLVAAPMDVDEKKPVISRRQRNLDDNFVDDDDLQSALARARQVRIAKAKARKAPEEIAAQIAEERKEDAIKQEEEEADFGDDASGGGGGLVFDETSEFVRAVEYNPEAKRAAVKVEPRPAALPASRQESPERMQVDQPLAELDAGAVHVKQEEDDDEDEEMMLDQIENAIRLVEEEEKRGNGDVVPDDDEVGTAGEATMGAGLAGALSVLRRQGILATPSADQLEREKVQVQRDAWLAEQRRRLARREEERMRSRGGGGGGGGQKDQAQREHENRLREQQEAREAAEHFKNYKPDVNIVYYDEFGRALSMKEAWKALSHRFHGKMPGRMKQEKRLKKIAEEKKREAMVSGDTPLNMNRAFQARQEKAGQAHMVLSVGNRGAVPQAEGFIDQPNLTKKTDGKGAKGKGKAPTPATPDITGFTAAQPLPVAAAGATGSPAPRAGFKRIGTFSAVTPAHDTSSPTPASPALGAEGAKVALSLKRKATDEGAGTPPAKRK